MKNLNLNEAELKSVIVDAVSKFENDYPEEDTFSKKEIDLNNDFIMNINGCLSGGWCSLSIFKIFESGGVINLEKDHNEVIVDIEKQIKQFIKDNNKRIWRTEFANI